MIYTYVMTAILSAALAFSSAWKIQNWRFGAKETTRVEQQITQERELALLERKHTQNVIDAQNAARMREVALRADAGRARSAADGLRSELTSVRASLPSLADDAVRKYASTLGDVFGECSSRLAEVAGQADGHASDSLMYQAGWPK